MMDHYHSIKPLECTMVGSGVVVKVEEEEVYNPHNVQNSMTSAGGSSIKREMDIKAEEVEQTSSRRKRKPDRRKRNPENNIGSVKTKPEVVIKTEDVYDQDLYIKNHEMFEEDESVKNNTGQTVKPEIEVKLEEDKSHVMADQQFEERDSSPAASPDYFLVQVKEEEEDMSFRMDYEQHGEKLAHPQTSSAHGEAVREKDARIHRMSSKMFIDIAQLIHLVQERPELYNPKTPSYADRYKKKKAWDEICAIVVPDWELCGEKEKNIKAKEVQTRWRSLKDCFRRELTLQKKLERSGIPTNRRRKYIHYDGLLFLEPTMKLRDSFSSPPATPSLPKEPIPIQQPIDVDQVTISPTIQPPLPLPLRLPLPQGRTLVRASPLSTPKKNKKAPNKNENEWERHLLNVMSTLRKKTEERSDSDEIFLKSLLPFVKKVPEDRKIDMQLSLMHVVKKFMGPVDKEPQTPNCQSRNSTYIPTHKQSNELKSAKPSHKNSLHPRTSPRPSCPAYEPSPTAHSQTSSFNYSLEPEALPAPPPYSSPSSSSSSTNRSPQSHRDSPYYFDL